MGLARFDAGRRSLAFTSMQRLFRAYLAIVFLANLAGMVTLAANLERIRGEHPRLSYGLVGTLYAAGVLSLVAVVCLWRWKGVGLPLIVAAYAVMLFVNLSYGAPLAHTLLGPLGLSLLLALFWPVRRRFRPPATDQGAS